MRVQILMEQHNFEFVQLMNLYTVFYNTQRIATQSLQGLDADKAIAVQERANRMIVNTKDTLREISELEKQIYGGGSPMRKAGVQHIFAKKRLASEIFRIEAKEYINKGQGVGAK